MRSFALYLLGKIKDALPRCEVVLREASLALLNKRRTSCDSFLLYLLGKIKDALPRCEVVLREANLALLNKRLRATRVDKALTRSADAGSFAGGQSPPTPPRALRRAFVYSSMRESRFLGHYRYLLKLIKQLFSRRTRQ